MGVSVRVFAPVLGWDVVKAIMIVIVNHRVAQLITHTVVPVNL